MGYSWDLQPETLPPEIKRDYLGVSSIATPPCELYYNLMDSPKDENDTSTRFGFDTAHLLESYVLDLLQVEDRQGEVSFPYFLAPDEVIKGHYDGRTNDLIRDGACIIEIKATGGYSFSKKIEEGADAGHVEQAFIYAAGSSSPYFIIIYCNREAKKNTAFYYVCGYHIPDMEAAQQAVRELFDERFAPVLFALHNKRPPQPKSPSYEFGPRGWRCRPDKIYFSRGKEQFQVGYCSYRSICPDALMYAEQEETKKQAEMA